MENQEDLQLDGAGETGQEDADSQNTADQSQDGGSDGAGKPDPLDEITDIEELRKAAKANRAIANRRAKAPKADGLPSAPKPKPEGTPKPQAADDIDSILSLQAEGYTPAEIKSLRAYAKKMNMPITEVAADEVVKAGFDALRQKAKVNSAIPSPSGRSFTFKNKPLNETIASGSEADAKAAVEQFAASRLRPKTND